MVITGYWDDVGLIPFLTDVSYQTPTADQIPTSADRSSGSGNTMGFDFIGIGPPIGLGMLAPGATSSLLVIQTDATSWESALAAVINGGGTGVSSFSPSPIPEPSAALLFGGGLLVVSAALRGRRFDA